MNRDGRTIWEPENAFTSFYYPNESGDIMRKIEMYNEDTKGLNKVTFNANNEGAWTGNL